MAITFSDIVSNYAWNAKHLDEILGGGSIVDTAKNEQYSLFDNGAFTMSSIYVGIVDSYSGRFGKPEIMCDSSGDFGILRLNPNVLSHHSSIRREYLVPESSIDAFRDDIAMYDEHVDKLCDNLPLRFDDGTVIDRVRVLEDGPDAIHSLICVFSPEYPRDSYYEKFSPEAFAEYGQYGETGYYNLSLFDEGFMNGGIEQLRNSDMLYLAYVLEDDKQEQARLMPELVDGVDVTTPEHEDHGFDF